MCTNQWKTVLVILNLFDRNHPSPDAVARLTGSAELALVNVGMAIRTLGSHIGKDRLGVALGTSHRLVHAAQRVAGPVVIKFRDCPNRFPAQGCMAILAGQVQISMRTPGLRVGLALSADGGSHRQQSKN